MKSQNEAKLIRNLDHIINKYLKIDNRLIETLINEDKSSFRDVVSENSTDNFLREIVNQYPDFTDELFDRLSSAYDQEIRMIERDKKVEKTILYRQIRKKRIKPVLTLKAPGKLKAKKGKKNKWTKQEINKINILIKSGKSSKEIKNNLNKSRLDKGQRLRTMSSVNMKIWRIKQGGS